MYEKAHCIFTQSATAGVLLVNCISKSLGINVKKNKTQIVL